MYKETFNFINEEIQAPVDQNDEFIENKENLNINNVVQTPSRLSALPRFEKQQQKKQNIL